MALQTNIEIYIGGNLIPTYKRLALQQDLDAHHMLTLVCRMDVLEKLGDELASESKNFLGEIITISVSSDEIYSDYGVLEFKGIVVKVNNTKAYDSGEEDTVEITAQSASIIADDGPHYASHSEVSLSDILTKTFEGYDASRLETAFNPQNTEALHYSVQQNESAFEYASRLAAQHSEWFYYDGKALVFGTPKASDEVPLTYGHDLKKFSLELNPSPNNFKYFTNDYLTDELHEKTSREINTGVNGYNGFTSQKSGEIYAKETSIYLNSYTDSTLKQRFDLQVEKQKKSRELKQVIVKGSSDNPGVYLGQVVAVKNTAAAQGSFRVTKVMHTATENGNYINYFEGVSAEIDIYPESNAMAYPRSESQVATVMDNADPDGLSRVKVQFAWQKPTGEMTPWLRMVTPHSGGEKGFHFIPEVGEEVIVGFEGGNAERPYVMGALYSGTKKPESWKTDANNIKAIRTRSGHTIELNDTQGEETISIYDNEGSIIKFDTQQKSLYIQSAENLELAAKNLKISAEENIDIFAKGNINTASEGDTSILSEGDSTMQAKGDANISSDAAINISASQDNLVTGQNVTVEGKAKTVVKGQQTQVQGQMTTVQGKTGKTDYM
ncbi:type VI secretion system Vgr family protein [Fulvivirga sediminis]|uniref:Gp5/Type VI secretion system Vgr protein OB-fold domain-containing protein n=1 Tax=Fulvivirga sediminis TaxID=2803949 RepID=A0A937K3K5_9BACT|nr:phage baseplate assembly protein V [Fulvivirga sediminis]MBL3659082.1 hypothetical protein [Fulvivirga sediminis]